LAALPRALGWFRLSRALGWFRLPRAPDPAAERHATWLELFFDLVFVLALLAVTARLDTDGFPSWLQLGEALGIYVLVQWAWVGQAFFDTRYDPDDVPHRLLVLLATAGAGVVSLGVRGAPAGLHLPVGYLVVRGVLILMYLRVLASDRSSRELVTVYLAGFGAGWLLWLGSLWLPAPARPVAWAVALGIELSTPWLGRHWLIRHPVHRSHLPERIGQFIIILLGSSLTNLRDAVPTAHPAARTLVAAGLALVVPVSIWWVYTAFLNSRLAVPRLASGQAYAYLHVPIGVGIILSGWALGRAVHNTTIDHESLPPALRLVLAASLATWILGTLGMQWFSRGALSRRKMASAAFGIVPIAATAAFVGDPIVLLSLTSAVMTGYATTTTVHIGRARAALGPGSQT
jgi:low temperature requirement protein LtrA